MLMYNEIVQPDILWEGHGEDLTGDLEQRLQHEHQDDELHLNAEQRKNLALYEPQVILNRNVLAQQLGNRLTREQLDYDLAREVATLSLLLPTVNSY